MSDLILTRDDNRIRENETLISNGHLVLHIQLAFNLTNNRQKKVLTIVMYPNQGLVTIDGGFMS